MFHVPLLFAFVSLSLAASQAPAAAPPAAASAGNPITVQLMTVADFPDVLGGQRVRIPDLAVKHVLGPRLLVVGRPRILGIDRSYQATFRYDKLLVLLPAAAELRREQVVTVTGDVRTLAAARALGLPVDQEMRDKETRRISGLTERTSLIVADTIETADGTVLVGRR